MSQELATLLFPHITKTIADYDVLYPPRVVGQKVSRFAPSPTGFLHIGGLYTANVAEKFVHQGEQRGIFFLRIEDTDQKRQVVGGVEQILESFQLFGISVDEGPIGADGGEIGAYGPYVQSARKDIYHAFIKELIARGYAYPCWMTEEEIDAVRTMQQAAKKIPGIYGHYSRRRDASFEQQQEMIATQKPYVIRLKSPAMLGDTIDVHDIIKGNVQMQANFIDVVLLKSTDQLPTYHMAHLVDDYLMRTTHVIRADERFASLPLHIQLFEVCGLTPPAYAHVSPLLKVDETTGNKRKLSKRHDSEASVTWFLEQGIPADAMREFLTNIVDSFFEDRQKNNPDKSYKDYAFSLERMNTAGALFDMQKLLFVSKEYLAKVDKETFFTQAIAWAEHYGGTIPVQTSDENVLLSDLMKKDPLYTFAALNIERMTPADPKRYRMYSDIKDQLPAFFDDAWEYMRHHAPATPSVCHADRMKGFFAEYGPALDLTMTKEEWFEQLKQIGGKHGFAASNADFKAGGYEGKIGDLAMYFRIMLLCSSTTPDLYESLRVLGKQRALLRLQSGL